MIEFPTFVINLDGSDDRLSAATAALAKQNAQFDRISAYDGRGKLASDIPEYSSIKTQKFLGRDLTGGEIGCFISHVAAAKAFLATDAPFGLVLEDDMVPEPDGIAQTIDLIKTQEHPDWYLAHLCAKTLKYASPEAKINETADLYRAHYFPMRTTALLWSRAGAAQFVKTCYPITCPIDIHLRHWLMQDDMGVACQPHFFSIAQTQSDIDAAQSGLKRGGTTRSFSYTFKRLRRMKNEKHRARTLSRQYEKGAVK